MARAIRILLLVGCALVWPAADAAACSCAADIPLCESFWRTPVVFAGEVLDIQNIPNPSGSQFLPHRLVRFRVDRAYRGELAGTTELTTGGGGGDCGYRFVRGGRYLVYANYYGGGLTTGICSRTQPLERATEDLQYLETAFAPSSAGRVFGHVMYQRMPGQSTRPAPAQGYQVVLTSEHTEWISTTDAYGSYEFPAVVPGTYDIRVVVADTERAYGGPTLGRRLELTDARGCASANFSIVPNGRIATRLVDPSGRPLAGLRLDVLAGEAPHRLVRSAQSDEHGEVTVSPLNPGRYLLGLNHSRAPDATQPFPRVYYPGVDEPDAAAVIDLSSGQRRDLDVFVLPAPLRQRQLTGTVTWPDGRPALDTRVHVVGAGTSWVAGTAMTDADGTFTIPVYDGVTYTLTASHTGPAPDRVRSQTRVEGITIREDTEPVHVVLRTLPR